jgi:hypothetical protein
VKSLQSCRVRAVLSARHQLVTMRTSLYNQIRGLLKGATFETAVLAGCPTDPLVRAAIAALLAAWRVAGERKRALELQLVRLPASSPLSCIASGWTGRSSTPLRRLEPPPRRKTSWREDAGRIIPKLLVRLPPDRANHMGSSAGEGHDEAIHIRSTSKTTRSAVRAKPLDPD